jgi:hypothetical protein
MLVKFQKFIVFSERGKKREEVVGKHYATKGTFENKVFFNAFYAE